MWGAEESSLPFLPVFQSNLPSLPAPETDTGDSVVSASFLKHFKGIAALLKTTFFSHHFTLISVPFSLPPPIFSVLVSLTSHLFSYPCGRGAVSSCFFSVLRAFDILPQMGTHYFPALTPTEASTLIQLINIPSPFPVLFICLSFLDNICILISCITEIFFLQFCHLKLPRCGFHLFTWLGSIHCDSWA